MIAVPPPSAPAGDLAPPVPAGAGIHPPAAGGTAPRAVASRSGGHPEPGRGRERVAAGATPGGAGGPTTPPRPAPLFADDGSPAVELLTTDDVCRRYGFKARTILNWVERGLLASCRTPGGQHRYTAAAVEAALARAARTWDDRLRSELGR